MNVTIIPLASRQIADRTYSRIQTFQSSPAPGVTTTLSKAARELSQSALKADAPEISYRTAELKRSINNVDFQNASPSEITELAFKLYESGELSSDQISGLVFMEDDTEPPISASKKINVLDHLNTMRNVVLDAARTDDTLDFAIAYSTQVIDTLNAVRAFAASDREHIL